MYIYINYIISLEDSLNNSSIVLLRRISTLNYICSQMRNNRTWLPADWTDSNVRFNCILHLLLFKQEKEWSLNYRNIVPQTAADCAAGHWDGNLATMAYFSELSDCGKISLLYSDIFPFFSYNEERD